MRTFKKCQGNTRYSRQFKACIDTFKLKLIHGNSDKIVQKYSMHWGLSDIIQCNARYIS